MIISKEQIDLQINQAKQKAKSLEIPIVIFPVIFISVNIILYAIEQDQLLSTIFGIISVIIIFVFMSSLLSQRKKLKLSAKEFENRIYSYYQVMNNTRIPENPYGFDENSSFGAPYFMWLSKDAIHFFPKPPTYYNYMLYNPTTEFVINFQYIKYYYRSGVKYYENKITGGGSTGPNLMGAIIGEEIAGAAGAVVMGQAKINPIESQLIIHDERRTIIAYCSINDTIANCQIPYDFYDVLYERIPELSRDFVETKNKSEVINKTQSENNQSTLEQKLKKLLDMKNAGLIDENDYRVQKEKLLEKL